MHESSPAVRTEDRVDRLDDHLGTKNLANSHNPARLWVGDKLAYEVVYNTDEYGRRVTPQGGGTGANFVMFVGCSFCFGVGLSDGDTLPAQFARLVADGKTRVYNYGVISWGADNVLALMQTPGLTGEIAEPRGILVYVFIDDHINRAIYQLYRRDAVPGPRHQWTADGRLAPYRGPRVLEPPGGYSLWRHWQRLLQYRFAYRVPPELAAEDFRQTARLIEKIGDVFVRRFKSDGVYVLFYPRCALTAKIAGLLPREKIRTLDYSGLFDKYWPRDPHEDQMVVAPMADLHPNRAAHGIVAAKLRQDIYPD